MLEIFGYNPIFFPLSNRRNYVCQMCSAHRGYTRVLSPLQKTHYEAFTQTTVR
jgi:hypothetical protein